MTPLEKFLKDAREVCEVATDGKWVGPLNTEKGNTGYGVYAHPDADTWSHLGDFGAKEDCEFAVGARTALPKLIRMVEEINKAIDCGLTVPFDADFKPVLRALKDILNKIAKEE